MRPKFASQTRIVDMNTHFSLAIQLGVPGPAFAYGANSHGLGQPTSHREVRRAVGWHSILEG